MAVFISVRQTLLNYSNKATAGVDAMAGNLQFSLRNAYLNIRMVQNQVRKKRVIDSISEAASQLDPGGFCMIYFHGHGDSIGPHGSKDEQSDEALVCYDGYVLDDEIDILLRSFHPSCRILSIMDCCSSRTVFEWKYAPHQYPQIIHIAASSDNGYAHSTINGGIMSNNIRSMVHGWGFTNYNYIGFVNHLKARMNHAKHPIHIRMNPNVQSNYLKTPLFT
jgi:hypothetical protein